MAAGLAARAAAAPARLQGGDPALEGHALPAAEAAGADRVPAAAAGPAPALPAPPQPRGTAGGRVRARAAAPGGAGARGQPPGGRVSLQPHGRGGRGHAPALPAPAQRAPALRPQRGGPAGAGAVQAAQSAAAVRVPQRAAGEPGGPGQGDAESAQRGAPGHPAGRLHRQHHPEPAGRGELRPAAFPGGVPRPDGGGAGPAALPNLLPAPAGSRPPHRAPGRAHPTAAGLGRSPGAAPGSEHPESVRLESGNQFLPWPWDTGNPLRIKDLGVEGHNFRGISSRGSGGVILRVLWAPPSSHSLGNIPGISGVSQRRKDGPSGRDFGHSKASEWGCVVTQTPPVGFCVH